MHAFILIPLPRSKCSPQRTLHTCLASKEEPPSPFSLDTLSNFESFCWRTQEWLCNETAAADGLGTFHPTPPTYKSVSKASPPRRRQRVMRGGRAFDMAIVSVWASAEQTGERRRAHTVINRRTARVEYVKDAAGISVKLQPRDPTLPALRADAHYFQIGGGRVAWWFAGTADISMGPAANPEVFMESVQLFLESWANLRKRHRMSPDHSRKAFLDDCLSMSDIESVARTVGLDRLTAYSFITEMVDALLPAYLPLLSNSNSNSKPEYDMEKRLERVWELGALDVGQRFREKEVDTFCIEGGAACESISLRASPLGSWRFSLAPSILTSAGKAYVTLRNDDGYVDEPFLFI